jgi:leucyl aminopeptidase
MKTMGLLAALLLPLPSLASDFEAPPAPAPEEPVFVSFAHADLAKPEAKGFPLSSPVISDGRTAVYKVRPEMLAVLSEFMHDRFKRCGGFFAHRTRVEAQAAMRPAAAKQAWAYTLDQQAVAGPLAASVKEANIRGTISALAAFNNRYYTADTGVDAARSIQSRWQEIASRIPGASVALVAHDGWKQPSVVLTIPGSEKPEEIVVLGGHLDSINGWGNTTARAPGADDNASGIAVLTEAARALADGGFRPRRTVQFMGYAAEEVGLRGSQDIAAKYASAGKKVVGVIQFDMSNFAGDGDKIFLLTDNVDKPLSDFTGRLIDAYAGVKWETTECGYGCSDHASWTKKGYAASMAFESSFDGMNHQIHTAKDTLETSGGDASHSVPFAKLAVGFAVELAKSAAAAGRVAAR